VNIRAQWFSLIVLSFIVLCPPFLHAQQNGTVTGLVQDSNGNPIPNAVVTLVNHSVGFSQRQTTTADGRYTFLQVKPAKDYVLTAQGHDLQPGVTQEFEVYVNDLYITRPPIRMMRSQPQIQQAEATNPPPPIAPEQPSQTGNVGQPPPQTQPSPTGQPGAAPTSNPVQVAGVKKPVPSERPTIAPDMSPTMSGVIDSNAVHNLPLADRDFITLALLVPGTYPLEQGSALEGASLVVNGIRGNMNNFLLDGADNNDYTINQSLPFQIVEAMQEFRVQTSTSTAAFGRTAGGQINVVSQSGSNRFHGTLFEFNRNSALSADSPLSTYNGGSFDAFAQNSRVSEILFGNNYYFLPNGALHGPSAFPAQVLSDPVLNNIFQQGRYVPLNQNQFGANLGGPIKKDKAFFFFNWESFRVADPLPVMNRVPDTNDRSVSGCPSPGCDPAAVALLNLYPVPNVPNTPNLTNYYGSQVSNQQTGDNYCVDQKINNGGNFVGNPFVACSGAFAYGNSRNFTNSNNYLGRVDLTPSANVGLSLKYNIQTFNQVQGGAVQQTSTYPGSGISLNGNNQNLSFNYVQNFGPLSTNKITFGWNRFSLSTLPLDSSLNASTFFQNLNFANQGLPSVLIGGFAYTAGPYASLGANLNAPYSRVDSVWSVTDNFSRSWGRHLLEFGGEFRYNRLNVDNEAAARGLVTLPNIDPMTLQQYEPVSFASIARVSLHFGGNADGVGSLARLFSDNSLALYAQDTWRLSPHVSLYYGLRYEVSQAPVEANNRLVNDYPGKCQDPNGGNLVCLIQSGTNQIYNSDGSQLPNPTNFTAPRAGFNTDFNNFGPRVGIAWSPGDTGQTVWRAGFAVMFDQQSLEPSVNMLLNPPFIQQTASFTLDDSPNGFTPGGLITTLNPTLLSTTFPAGFLQSTAQNPGGGESCTSASSCVPGFVPYDGKTLNSYWFPQPYSITARDPNTRTPYVYQYNLGVQEQLGNNAVLGIAYVGSLGRKLPSNLLLTECTGNDFRQSSFPFVNPSCAPPLGGFNLFQPFGEQGGTSQLSNSIIYQTNNANSNFNALQVRLDMRSYHGLTIQAFYQWAHSIDDATSPTAPVFLLSPTAASIMSAYSTGCLYLVSTCIYALQGDQLAGVNNINPTLNLRPGLPVITTADVLPNDTNNSGNLANQHASSDFDIRQRFVIGYTYVVPTWKGAGRFGNGWQLSGITQVQSGQPYSVYSNFFGAQLRPDPNGPTQISNSNPNGAIDNLLPAGCNAGTPNPLVCYGTNAVSSFNVVNSTSRFMPGSLARNTFYGPGLTNFDFSVLKNTYFRESRNLQFRAEFFNLFNHTNLMQPFSQAGTFSVGTDTVNRFFGQILQARAARQIQFGLKFIF
jgi:hypothetical protein